SSGTIATDSSGNGNDGTLVNKPAWVAGRAGGGLQFDGVTTSMMVTLSPSSSLNGLFAFTFAAWIYPKSGGLGGYGRIFSKESAPESRGTGRSRESSTKRRSTTVR